MYHNPVMLNEAIDGLNIQSAGVYVDVTYGSGGHSKAILKRLGAEGKLIVFDQDEDAEQNLIEDERIVFVPQNFRHLKRFLKYHGVNQVNGILADLGVSSHQFDKAERGFSIRFDAELDMRMSKTSGLTAFKVLQEYDEKELLRIMSEYGEVHNAKTLVRRIIEERNIKSFDSTFDLMQRMNSIVYGNPNAYFAKVFQALRIEVNEELKVLNEFLMQCYDVLKVDGRLVVMSYHSLEDRMVKNFIKTGNTTGDEEKNMFGVSTKYFKAINKKVITPTEEEIKINPRSRSAKLRIAEKI